MSDNKEIDEVTSIPSEIRQSLAEVVVDLLKPPAKELGNLLGDTIGILSDRVRRKRELNAEIGLSETRKKLEEVGITIEAISPPKEEELHLLLNGLSLSDDETVRNLWAGIFAQSLNPNSDIIADRPFISVLESLSPPDAKIIDFLAFAIKVNAELQNSTIKFMPSDLSNITSEDREKLDKAQVTNRALQIEAVKKINEKAKEYDLNDLNDSVWSSNLMRQGIIDRVRSDLSHLPTLGHHVSTARDFDDSFALLNKYVGSMANQAKLDLEPPSTLFTQRRADDPIELKVQLTPFGTSLARACGLL